MKWEIVQYATPVNQNYVWSDLELVDHYSNVTTHRLYGIRAVFRAIRIRDLVTIAGKTMKEWNLPDEFWEDNKTGFHFIRIRDDVTVEDFTIRTIART